MGGTSPWSGGSGNTDMETGAKPVTVAVITRTGMIEHLPAAVSSLITLHPVRFKIQLNRSDRTTPDKRPGPMSLGERHWFQWHNGRPKY